MQLRYQVVRLFISCDCRVVNASHDSAASHVPACAKFHVQLLGGDQLAQFFRLPTRRRGSRCPARRKQSWRQFVFATILRKIDNTVLMASSMYNTAPVMYKLRCENP